jgi:hypothetical protein
LIQGVNDRRLSVTRAVDVARIPTTFVTGSKSSDDSRVSPRGPSATGSKSRSKRKEIDDCSDQQERSFKNNQAVNRSRSFKRQTTGTVNRRRRDRLQQGIDCIVGRSVQGIKQRQRLWPTASLRIDPRASRTDNRLEDNERHRSRSVQGD